MLNIAKYDTFLKVLDISSRELKHILLNINRLYKIDTEPKKSGGKRIIEKPSNRLKYVQTKIKDLLKRYTFHEAVHGLKKGKSSKDNALAHLGARALFQSDVRDFYPSVHSKRIYLIFQNELGCSPEISQMLTRLTTYNSHLPTGAPTSPFLANIIMNRLDSCFDMLGKAYDLKYSRYMDDITFAGNVIPKSLELKFYVIMSRSGLRIHRGKTGIFMKNKPQIITGVCINTGRLKVPRKYKRKIRAILHQSNVIGFTNIDVGAKVAGMLRYIKYIEG